MHAASDTFIAFGSFEEFISKCRDGADRKYPPNWTNGYGGGGTDFNRLARYVKETYNAELVFDIDRMRGLRFATPEQLTFFLLQQNVPSE